MKYYSIGDIHGNLKGLEQCLERSDFNADEDTLIGIGDYVDGHSQSAEVIQKLIDLPNFIGIMGNHDIWFKDWLLHGTNNVSWLTQGGQATVNSYIDQPEYLTSDDHKKFVRNLHNYYILELNGKKYGFVHGGWKSKKGLGHDKYQDNYYWDRDLWHHATLGRMDYVEARWGDLDYAFIGHTATDYNFPEAEAPVTGFNGKLINLDQGAGYKGKLTICNIETLECWQSDPAINLYGKSGR